MIKPRAGEYVHVMEGQRHGYRNWTMVGHVHGSGRGPTDACARR